MEKITKYSWCFLFFCMVCQYSFCGKVQSVFLGKAVCLQECDEQRSWQQQQRREIKQPDAFFRRHPVSYDESLFGPSVFGKKMSKQSGLKRSPESDNLLRDSQESDTQSLTSQELSSSESSRASTPESQRPIVVPMLISAAFKNPRRAATHLRVVITRRHVEEEDKPRLIAISVGLFKGLDAPR